MAILNVKVEQGRLRGVPGNNPCFSVFKNIPYAAPPVGDLRWKAPQPALPWDGVRDACRFGNIPWQPDFREIDPGHFYLKEFWYRKEERSEDCLYLNVWTPAESTDEKLPVFFWIHGGEFRLGYGFEPEFDGEGFCRRGVIFVSINYRHGVFGFLAHQQLNEESSIGTSGNYGILDQIAALKWVRRNIVQFGGDPDNITICGQSAGAASVQILVSTPLTKADIAKAMMMSGGGFPTFGGRSLTPMTDAVRMGETLMQNMGTSTIAELRGISAQDLTIEEMNMDASCFFPIVDGYVLEEDIHDTVLKDGYLKIPYMLGTTKDELKDYYSSTVEEYRTSVKKEMGQYAEKYLELCNIKSMEDLKPIISMSQKMLLAVQTFAKIQEMQKRPSSYIYYFNKDIPGGDNAGTFHSSELWYIFQTYDRSWRRFKGSDYELSGIMADYVANFAKYGDPNGDTIPKWTAFSKESPLSMNLGETIGMKQVKLTPAQEYYCEFLLREFY